MYIYADIGEKETWEFFDFMGIWRLESRSDSMGLLHGSREATPWDSSMSHGSREATPWDFGMFYRSREATPWEL